MHAHTGISTDSVYSTQQESGREGAREVFTLRLSTNSTMASIMEAVSLLRTDIWYGRQVLSFFNPSLKSEQQRGKIGMSCLSG